MQFGGLFGFLALVFCVCCWDFWCFWVFGCGNLGDFGVLLDFGIFVRFGLAGGCLLRVGFCVSVWGLCACLVVFLVLVLGYLECLDFVGWFG